MSKFKKKKKTHVSRPERLSYLKSVRLVGHLKQLLPDKAGPVWIPKERRPYCGKMFIT
jgi:hypothetical protein